MRQPLEIDCDCCRAAWNVQIWILDLNSWRDCHFNAETSTFGSQFPILIHLPRIGGIENPHKLHNDYLVLTSCVSPDAYNVTMPNSHQRTKRSIGNRLNWRFCRSTQYYLLSIYSWQVHHLFYGFMTFKVLKTLR